MWGPSWTVGATTRPRPSTALEDYHSAVLELRRTGGIHPLPPLPKIAGISGRLVEAVAVPVGAAASSESSSPNSSTNQDD